MLKLHYAIICLLYGHLSETMAFPSILSNINWMAGVESPDSFEWPQITIPTKRETAPNGSTIIWVIQDTYEGSTFFDTFDFYTGPDPTNFVDQQTAFNDGLAYVTSDNQVIMRGDNTTQLAYGVNRSSVRIASQAQYNMGLFILDLNMAPWGCGATTFFQTVGNGPWPYTGEIDIIEGVHDNEYNQVTWHTAPEQTNGTDNLQCNAFINDNAGCGVTEWSHASYGPLFDEANGGVFAMKWDENGIAVCTFIHPIGGEPVAELTTQSCNITNYFVNHSIIFGDWAGNSYATSNCPGTCESILMDPANFINASWIINSLSVYKQAWWQDSGTSSATRAHPITNLKTIGWIISTIIFFQIVHVSL
ncbi:glycoside hydrolase family 16 protein [Suillus subalutaceus]|uniref:glycoside hydrolase family 16 protein n=1 Tax=Suillus subalutaceus TaxID=48586 RepID=UPI001B86659D|nr:glycoside hydrolase family 16 protein [Suillus subalutaceus]KAG1864180.1 glycoside hydrolase family 16 protein [Suillus subalutaceus]